MELSPDASPGTAWYLSQQDRQRDQITFSRVTFKLKTTSPPAEGGVPGVLTAVGRARGGRAWPEPHWVHVPAWPDLFFSVWEGDN